MLTDDYGDDALTQELDPNLDDDYIMLFERRKAVQPSKDHGGQNYRRRISEKRHLRKYSQFWGEDTTGAVFGAYYDERSRNGSLELYNDHSAADLYPAASPTAYKKATISVSPQSMKHDYIPSSPATSSSFPKSANQDSVPPPPPPLSAQPASKEQVPSHVIPTHPGGLMSTGTTIPVPPPLPAVQLPPIPKEQAPTHVIPTQPGGLMSSGTTIPVPPPLPAVQLPPTSKEQAPSEVVPPHTAGLTSNGTAIQVPPPPPTVQPPNVTSQGDMKPGPPAESSNPPNKLEEIKGSIRGSLADLKILSTSIDSDISQDSDRVEEEVLNGQIRNEIKQQIIDIILKDNYVELQKILRNLKKTGIKVEIKDINLGPLVDSNAYFVNLLHYALQMKATSISQFLVRKCSPDLLLDGYEFKDNMGRRKSMTCLHIVAEKNQVNSAKEILEKLTDKEKISLMKKKGHVRLAGQSCREVLWLHVACYYGHLEIVKLCLEKGMTPDETDSKGESGLFWACKTNQISVAQFLLNKNADVNLVSTNGTPPLHMAVRHNSFNCVKLIMEYNPDVSAKRGLGFETPLILASVFGYNSIVQILVEAGTDVSESTSCGETAMHAAASEGWTNVMEVLFNSKNDPSTINALSRSKETPLHYAVAQEQVDAIQFLVSHGADSTLRDKHGNTVWHEAISSHKANAFATLLLTVDPKLLDGKVSPLHLVAATPDSSEEFDFIRYSEMNMNARDSEDNTCLHTAAKHGNLSVIKDGLGIINANQINSSGNTPLHEAAKSGHSKTVKLLLRSCQLDILNNCHETALHCAVKSPHASADVVREIIKHMKNTNSLRVLNTANNSGNTVLHLAAKFNRPEVVKYLTDISPSISNHEGDNALHITVRNGHLDVLKEILKCFEYEVNINQRTEDGETLLHLAAKSGHVDVISILIDYGIDLAVQDDSGNTFLHDLAEQAGADPDHQDMYNDVFNAVVINCLRWWCKACNLAAVDDDSAQSVQQRKDALWYLRSETINNDGLTALQVAVKHGASSLVEKMIQVPLVFVNKSCKLIKYDVTDLLPDTMQKSNKTSTGVGKSDSDPDSDSSPLVSEKKGSVSEVVSNGILAETDAQDKVIQERKPVRASLLEIIVSKRPLNIADVMLDIEPLKQVADGYWMLYQLITSFLLILHIVYMSALSAFAVPQIRLTLTSNLTDATEMPDGPLLADKNLMYGLFLVWPLGMFLQEGYYISSRIYRLARKLDVSEPAFDEIRSDPKQPISFSDAVICLFLYYLPHVVNLTFSVLVIVWFHLYMTSNKYHGVLLAYVMLIGWLSTIAFTRTFRPMHGFTVMLRNIFIKDVLKFLFLYVFILLAFGFAFDCLARLSPEVYSEFKGANEIFYQTIGMLLGAGDVMVDNIEEKYEASGYSPIHYKFFYLLYALVTVVVLLNILIAMMNDSYGDIKSKEGVSFRVISIQQAIQFEKTVPLLHSCIKPFRRRRQNCYKKDSRWYMEVEDIYNPQEKKSDERHIILNSINSKLDKLSQQQIRIAEMLSLLKTRVDKMESQNEPMANIQASNSRAAFVDKI